MPLAICIDMFGPQSQVRARMVSFCILGGSHNFPRNPQEGFPQDLEGLMQTLYTLVPRMHKSFGDFFDFWVCMRIRQTDTPSALDPELYRLNLQPQTPNPTSARALLGPGMQPVEQPRRRKTWLDAQGGCSKLGVSKKLNFSGGIIIGFPI